MRKENLVSADVKGSKELIKDHDKYTANEKAFHMLVCLMLSAQTKDEVTHATLRYLVEQKKLSIATILKTDEKELNEWISKVGFHNKKASYIIRTT